jgi:hypothetical protein
MGSVGVHQPQLGLIPRAEEWIRRPLGDDLPAVARQPIADDGVATAGDAGFGLAPDVHFPEVRLLIVLRERVHVVLGLLPRLLLVALRVGRREVQRRSIRSPLDLGDGRRMVRERPRLAAVNRQQVDLLVFGAASLGEKRDRPAVWRPARRAFAVAEGELGRVAAGGGHPPDVCDALVGLPVRNRHREHDRPAVGREVRVGDAGHADEIDESHRPRLGGRRSAARERGRRGDNHKPGTLGH